MNNNRHYVDVSCSYFHIPIHSSKQMITLSANDLHMEARSVWRMRKAQYAAIQHLHVQDLLFANKYSPRKLQRSEK
jgi:hypothetical protein